MICCAVIPFCLGGAILMVCLTSTFTPFISERYGGYTLLLIPLSALFGIILGWFSMLLFFSLI